jgi:uncharacterized protein YebE (UPF0316 family)
MFAPLGMDPTFFSFVVVPILIFFARICDMTLDTVRIIFVSKGYKYISAVLGFFEVIIWLVAITQIMSNLTNIFCYLAYGAGFATGNFVGMVIEEKISLGKVSLKVVARKNASKIIEEIEKLGHLVTVTDAYSEAGSVKIIYAVMQRKEVSHVVEIIKKLNPTAFYWVEEVRFANDEDPIMKKAIGKNKYRGVSVRR